MVYHARLAMTYARGVRFNSGCVHFFSFSACMPLVPSADHSSYSSFGHLSLIVQCSKLAHLIDRIHTGHNTHNTFPSTPASSELARSTSAIMRTRTHAARSSARLPTPGATRAPSCLFVPQVRIYAGLWIMPSHDSRDTYSAQ